MLNFFKGIKDKVQSTLHSQPPQPVYKQYTHAQLKIIAMKTRLVLQQLYKKQKQKITQKDSEFKKLQSTQSPLIKQYQILQQIGHKIIQVQSIKLYIQFLRKIEAYAPQIINKKGDISLMRQQMSWFQCILWYRRCKKIGNIEQFNGFCFNFFKGVDITQELNVRCELFKVYEELKYLQQGEIVPIDYLVPKIVPFVSFAIQEKELQQMKVINEKEIKEKQMKEKENQRRRNVFGGIEGVNNNDSNRNFNNLGSQQQQQQYYQQQYQYQQQPYQQRQQPYQNSPYQQQPHQQNPYPYQQGYQQSQNYNPYNPNTPFPQNISNSQPNPIQNNNINNINNNMNPSNSITKDNKTTNNISPSNNQNTSNTVNKHELSNNEDVNQSTLGFLPKDEFENNHNDNLQDEGFAIDRFSRNNIQQQQQPITQQKSFKSSQLNLVDWESMYKRNAGSITQPNNQNLVHNNEFEQIRQSNQYDELSFPYPPSGVISTQQLKADHQFYVDSLQRYQSEPISRTDKNGNNVIESNIHNNNNENTKPKGFNKLFGNKLKALQSKVTQEQNHQYSSILNNTNTQISLINQGGQLFQKQQKQKDYQHNFNINIGKFISSDFSNIHSSDDYKNNQQQNQCNIEDSDNNNNNNTIESKVRRLSQDEVEQYLRNRKSQNCCQNNNDNQVDDDQIDRMLNDMRLSQQHGQSQQIQQIQNKDQQYYQQYYPVDNERIQSSTLKLQQQQQIYTPQAKNHHEDLITGELNENEGYLNLSNDLVDSLNIIRRHFGQQLVHYANGNTGKENQQQLKSESNERQMDLEQHPNSINKKSIKKPYMVSIYARQQFLQSLKNKSLTNQNNQ